MRSIGLLGAGATGESILRQIKELHLKGISVVGVTCRPQQFEMARLLLPHTALITDSVEELLAIKPDIVLEAAGHDAVARYGAKILQAGCDLLLLSVGALNDQTLADALESQARQHDSKILISAGALAGFDGLMALRIAGLHSVRYTSIKPPHAWSGTPADAIADLERITNRTVILDSTAREAARLFPKNANSAAAVALAGMGFDQTQVVLIADPAAVENSGIIEARGAAGSLRVEVTGAPTATNPKTSAIVANAVVAELANNGKYLQFA